MSTSNILANDDRRLLDLAAECPEFRSLAELTPDILADISHQQGIEFATALLFDRIIRCPKHRPFVERMQQLQQQQTSAATECLDATVVFIPGAFYVEHPDTGADAAILRAEASKWGCPTELIPTVSIGTAAENGQIVLNWLLARPEKQVILVSLSKGSADIKMALAQPGAQRAFRNVVAWININGILNGSPMVTWIHSRRWARLFCWMLFWIRGRNYQFIRELERRDGGALDFELQRLDHMRVIHVAGFSLFRHTSGRRARRWYRRLASFGPNDSVMMLADLCDLPGHVFPVWGTDHYLQTGWKSETLIGALLQYLGEELDLFQPCATADMVTQ